MNGFVLAGVAIAAFAAGAALVSFRYERELRRMARFLDQREPTGNARMTAFVRTRGVLGIARGVNAELDELQNERIASQQARQAFQAGLTCLSHDIRTPLAGAQGYLQLVEDEADPAAKERYLSAAAHRLDDVRVLLDDLFSFAQVHDPSFEVAYEPVRPADVLGDVLAGDTPYIFVQHRYASSSLAGALACVVLWPLAGEMAAMLCGGALVVAVPILSPPFSWYLPTAHD